MSSRGSSASPQGERPKVFDGKCMREIWRPSDGNGNPDISLFEATRYTATGHPTWKLYCGDAPKNQDGVFQDPPKHVYLDDRACYRILHFAGYSAVERSKSWRHDFDNKGGLKLNRKNRGRPAIVEGGDIAEITTSTNKLYRFSGAADLREVDLIAQETAAQSRGDTLVVSAAAQGRSNGTTITTKKRKIVDELIAGVPTKRQGTVGSDDEEVTALMNGRDKRQRTALHQATFAAISTNSIPELKATIVSLQDRARITSDTLLDLQKRNKELELNLKSQEVLYHRANAELTEARKRNHDLSKQLQLKAGSARPTVQKDAEIATLRNQAAIYRTIAIQLRGRTASTASMLDKSVAAATAIEQLSETLLKMKEDLRPMLRAKSKEEEGWAGVEKTMREMLGDEWEKFEEESKERSRFE